MKKQKINWVRQELSLPFSKLLLTMKLTFVLLLGTTLTLLAGNSYSQATKLSLKVEDTSIKEILSDIEDQSEFFFMYNSKLIDVDRKVSVNFKEKKISDVLSSLFSDTDVKFVTNDKIIILTPVTDNKEFLFQQLTINGKVTDKDGYPLPGVNVVEKGTTNGAVTDLDGKYSISVKSDNATLVFSFVGFLSEEALVNGQSTIDIMLVEDILSLDEVVVVGYGVQKKSSVTGSISQVKSEDVANRTITSAEQALQGKTAGVQIVTTSGAPGSSPAIRVRGYSSNSDMSPLYVVDGIIVSDISNIDPNDIQSMEVLKDASSAAIYGAQAGNGVVLITTKRGSSSSDNWGKISYDYMYSSQSVATTPNLMNAAQYAEFMVEAGSFSQSAIDTYWDGVTDTDWVDAVFDNSVMQKHSVSYTNGNDKGAFYSSLSYVDNNGIQVGDKDTYKRLTGVVNADYKIKPWFKLSTTNNIERRNLQSGGAGVVADVFLMDPLTPTTYSESELPANMQTILNNGWTILQDDNGDYYSISNFYNFNNPLASIASSTTKNESFSLFGNFSGDFTPIKGLTVTSKFGYNLGSASSNTYNNDYYGSTQRYNEFVTLNQSNSTTINYQWDNYANYMTTLGDNHDISAMVGHSFIKNSYYYTQGGLTANGEDAVLLDDAEYFGWLDYASSSAGKTNSGGLTLNSSESYFGRFNYTYAGKYMVQFSLRADAFDLSKLPLTNRWGYFPAASAAWTVSEEKFWASMPQMFYYLKVRGSWGKNGSIGPLSGYQYATSMANAGMYSFGNESAYNYVSGSAPASMGNDNLSWETSTQFNIGFDARFLNGRLATSFDYFDKQTEDLLVTGLKSSLIAGGEFSPMNAGAVSNTGVEIELGWDDRIGNDFSYGIHANASTLKNKVTYLEKSIDYIEGTRLLNDPVTIFEEGNKVWHYYGYKFTGVDSQTGEATFEDINGDRTISTEDRTNIGSAIPKLTYGITLTAAYKGFDAIVFGSGTYGNKIFQCLFSNDRAVGNRIYEEFYEDRWTATNTDAEHPSASADISKYIVSSAMVKDGSFFKIKQIQLGYTFPKPILSNLKISNLRLYVSLEDFFTFTKYNGFDPEASSAGTGSQQGVDTAVYPISKKFVAGLNLTF